MKRARFVACALAALACACRAGDPARVSETPTEARAVRAPADSPTNPAAVAPLDYVERCIASDCAERLPVVLVIHGLGDSPERFIGLYDALPVPARVVALRAPIPWGDGFAWWPYRSGNTPPETIARPLAALVPRVAATLEAVCAVRPCDGRVLVSGFSQGGMLSYAVAALAPDLADAAYPLGGFLVPGVDVAPGDVPVLAYHGRDDRMVLASWDEANVGRLRAAGRPVELVLVDGVGHAVPDAIRLPLLRAMGERLLLTPAQ